MNDLAKLFFEKGWCRFSFDPALTTWIDHALPLARQCVKDPANDVWHYCDDTWFVGVNALNNDGTGAVGGGVELSGKAIDFIHQNLGLPDLEWDRGQVSVCYPGYPKPMARESEAASRYRRNRDAAHIDGLLHEGPERRRFLREFHLFILGIPMVDFSDNASPFVIWEGSHTIIHEFMHETLKNIPTSHWGDLDMTEAYQAIRRQVFETCKRVEISAKPGEAYIAHRFCVHGIAPWADTATAGIDGRIIMYFRPETPDHDDWLNAP